MADEAADRPVACCCREGREFVERTVVQAIPAECDADQ